MEHIITELATVFIKNISEILSSGKNFDYIEVEALREVKECAAKIIGAYVQKVDAAILSDKKARKTSGYVVERRNDERRIHSLVGLVTLERTLYKKASGGYEYLADTALGIEARSRVSTGTALAMVQTAKEVSYAKSSKYVTSGAVSRQTVMGRIRRSCAVKDIAEDRLVVPELHIDADEDHVTLIGGKNTEVPLISVYEGIETKGKRRSCKNIFHISEYGKTPDDLWEQTLTEIERRYDITNTKIYLHGDGAAWVQKGLEWIQGAIFVLDKYHKNKEIKNITAGLDRERRIIFNETIRSSLAQEDMQLFNDVIKCLRNEFPQRSDKIKESARYLKKFVKGISICTIDPSANNGGCTEPHVSHILSARLSSRPMAWSKATLSQFAPILAANQIILRESNAKRLSKHLRKTITKAQKEFLKRATGLPHPNAIGTLPINGKRTGTQRLLKLYA